MQEHEEWVWAGVYTLLSMITRFWRIGAANYVVWDEAHFGKFGTHYIKRDFYFDVHPPLGKMLVGLAGLLSGYQGNFEFKSGVAYPEDVPYTAMRVMLASFGVALVPLAWFTSGELGWSRWTRHWVTICVLCGEFQFSSHGPMLTDFFSRHRMALYFSIYSPRLHAFVLHLYDDPWSCQVPQPTTCPI